MPLSNKFVRSFKLSAAKNHGTTADLDQLPDGASRDGLPAAAFDLDAFEHLRISCQGPDAVMATMTQVQGVPSTCLSPGMSSSVIHEGVTVISVCQACCSQAVQMQPCTRERADQCSRLCENAGRCAMRPQAAQHHYSTIFRQLLRIRATAGLLRQLWKDVSTASRRPVPPSTGEHCLLTIEPAVRGMWSYGQCAHRCA